jgi:ethanolamine utilization microcompartment shell protein EutL
VPKGDNSKILIGEPVDGSVDVGAAVRKGEDVQVKVYSGTSVLDAGSPTGETATIGRVLSPLAQKEVGTIRCIGLNVSLAPLKQCKILSKDCFFR